MEYFNRALDWWRRKQNSEEQNGAADDLACMVIYRNALSAYKDLVQLTAADDIDRLDATTGISNRILLQQAIHDLLQPDGIVIPVMVRSGRGNTFAASAIAELYPDESMSVPPVQALLLHCNSEADSVRLTEGMTQPDATSFVWALIDAGRFMYLFEENTLIRRSDYIAMRNET
ncbi:MAG: hypothetical protein TR69_WS6001000744 [candidate division WS6 bacterium OLB20]|uniref:Uncharacterized protein n=1 Tax=candidate division WS6 bacterium OLB20 TaxID=1617426 RepID=A0A136LYI8_9BACT|nr:MAG: hypothetical protein TR69_WS6001000744 [candidate division WS6 bacterium OLB20]